MSYPFARAPTTGDIIARFIEGFEARLTETSPIIGPKGKVVIRYLARDTDDGILLSEPLADHDDEHMGWDKLRRVCRQLGVDLRDLGVPGLHLG